MLPPTHVDERSFINFARELNKLWLRFRAALGCAKVREGSPNNYAGISTRQKDEKLVDASLLYFAYVQIGTVSTFVSFFCYFMVSSH
jgi:hypothetical protein